MSSETVGAEPKKRTLPASVVRVYNKYRVVINRGEDDDVHDGQEFLLYALSDEEIIDPTTGENLGRLEIPKGSGEVINVQARMATVHSNVYPASQRTIKRGGYSFGEEEIIVPSKTPKPFYDPQVGDLAKSI